MIPVLIHPHENRDFFDGIYSYMDQSLHVQIVPEIHHKYFNSLEPFYEKLFFKEP